MAQGLQLEGLECDCCRPFPDEEGTESRMRQAGFFRRDPVADRSPMRRGLKDDDAAMPDQCDRRVADRSPMRRGLK